MNKKLTYLSLLLWLFILCGCEQQPPHTPPPTERLALVTRFFRSIENNDTPAAVEQGKKIFYLDQSQNHVRTLITIQESNSTVTLAQQHLADGRIDDAQKVIADALKNYPDNEVLKRSAIKLAELGNAEKYLNEMDKARTAAAMSNARETAETGLSETMTPELTAYLRQYEQREKVLAKQEQNTTQAAMEAATRAAEKAKAEDARREAENIRKMKEMDELTKKGDEMRRNAGEIPFETETPKNTEKR